MFVQRLRNPILSELYSIKKFDIPQARCMSCKKKFENKTKQKLLKFPALRLDQTMAKFLKSVQPLLTCKEFEETKCKAKNFIQGEGAELQKLLEEVASKEDNWLAPRWLKVAYLGYRQPVTVYSSPGMTLPLKTFKNNEDYLIYTAKLIVGLIKFKKLVDDDKIPIVKMGKHELDNSQFKTVFGTCRIPLAEIDALEFYPKSEYVTIIHKNHFYKLPVFNKMGEILNFNVLAKQLRKICDCENEFGLPVGVLSTDNRDNWAKSYEQLIENYTNCTNVKIVQKSLFTVSLDQEVPFNDTNKYEVLGQQLIHGGGTKQNSANRWMDKTIQVLFT